MSTKNKIWLPLEKYYKRGRKTTILIIPGASQMDKSELDEIIAWQTEKIEKEPVQPEVVMPSQEVKGMLNDFVRYLRRKRRDSTRKWY